MYIREQISCLLHSQRTPLPLIIHSSKTEARPLQLLTPLIVLLMQSLNTQHISIVFTPRLHSPLHPRPIPHPQDISKTHLRQTDSRHDDLIQRTRRISPPSAGISTRMVLVLAFAAGLPGLGAFEAGGGVVGRCRRRWGLRLKCQPARPAALHMIAASGLQAGLLAGGGLVWVGCF